MTTTPSTPTPSPTSWKNPDDLLAQFLAEPDEVSAELLRLARAARTLRDAMGPTVSVEAATHFVRHLVTEVRGLTDAQRHRAAGLVRSGTSVVDAVNAATTWTAAGGA